MDEFKLDDWLTSGAHLSWLINRKTVVVRRESTVSVSQMGDTSLLFSGVGEGGGLWVCIFMKQASTAQKQHLLLILYFN